jgi:hypothetical protein
VEIQKLTYLLVHTDGRIERIESRELLPLARLQELVGGYIEYVRMTEDMGCMVNEEGYIRELPYNARYPNLNGPVLFGRMVLGPDGEDFAGLSLRQLTILEAGGSFGEEVADTIYMSRSRTLTDDDMKIRIVDPTEDPLRPKGSG